MQCKQHLLITACTMIKTSEVGGDSHSIYAVDLHVRMRMVESKSQFLTFPI